MGTLISKPYELAEGQEYVTYLEHVLTECDRLVGEGRVPSDEGILGFLQQARVVLRCVRTDVATAQGAGRTTVRSHVPMTHAEHQRYLAMNDSLRSLLEILELRQAVVLNRTEAAGRVSEALVGGDFTP